MRWTSGLAGLALGALLLASAAAAATMESYWRRTQEIGAILGNRDVAAPSQPPAR